jgi:hypothetical protein
VKDFDELVGGDDLTPAERARLRHVHDLLVHAGPPPDLPPALERPSAVPDEAEVIRFPLPRRAAAAAVAAAAMVAAGFGIGFLVGHTKAKPATFAAVRVVSMHGRAPGRFAVIRIADRDSVGNWPMELTVSGLPAQHSRSAYYELWLTENGRPTKSCGTFRVHGGTTSVRFTVPYGFKNVDGWVVTAETSPAAQRPGPVVLTT